MRRALALAEEAADAGEVPVGCVIVRGTEIVGEGRNRREADKNALAHAEIEAIAAACRTLGGWRLSGCTMYVTLEPCVMCAGAIAAAVNEYFAAALPSERMRRAAADTSYERYYDAAEMGMDFARSHAIEAASWANTELLAPQDAAEAVPPEPQPETETKAAPPGGVPEAELLRAMLSGGTLEAFCRAHGGAPNDAAARVNEYFADALGDVVLEQDGAGSWRLIEDYRFDVEAALVEM